MNNLTVTQTIDKFLTWCREARNPKTTDKYERLLKKVAAHFGPVELAALTPAAVDAFTRNLEIVRSVVRLCSWAHREARLMEQNPLLGISLPEAGARQRTLERKDKIRLMRAADRAFRFFLVALNETMARPRELRDATWEEIRIDGNRPATVADLVAGLAFFQLSTFKGRSRRKDRMRVRIIPITPRLGRLLARLAGRPFDVSRCVFLNARRRPWTVNAVRSAMYRLRERAGLVADHTGEKIVCYSLRHTGATEAVRAGVRDFQLAQLLGHASVRTTERYVHLVPKDIRAAMMAARMRHSA